VATASVGKVLVTARIDSLEDLFRVNDGLLSPENARSAEVDDALVDTGAMMLSLPTRLVDRLGLKRYRKRRVRTTAGIAETSICEAVRLTIQDRECTVDVAEVSDECPVLVGQIPLEAMDFVVDPVNQRVIGNPAHGGEQMIELY
jgi:predicted aspartyl protease